MYKIIVESKKRCLEEGLNRIKLSRYGYCRKAKARAVNNLVKDKRILNLKSGFTLMKRNLLSFKQHKLENAKGELERRLELEGIEELKIQ